MQYRHRKERLETSKEKISRKFSPIHPLSKKKAVNSMRFLYAQHYTKNGNLLQG